MMFSLLAAAALTVSLSSVSAVSDVSLLSSSYIVLLFSWCPLRLICVTVVFWFWGYYYSFANIDILILRQISTAQDINDISETQLDGILEGKVAPVAAPPGKNVDGGSVFTNFKRALLEEQLFFVLSRYRSGEEPFSDPVNVVQLFWCSDLVFSNFVKDNSLPLGYAGKCVGIWSSGSYDGVLASGAQLPYVFDGSESFAMTYSISSVFVEHLNIFEGEYHKNNDDVAVRFLDDGRQGNPTYAWEPRDEGDKGPNAGTSSWSQFGDHTWLSTADASLLLKTAVQDFNFNNTTAFEFTPETFQMVYANIWIKLAKAEAANSNPFPDSQLKTVKEVIGKMQDAGMKLIGNNNEVDTSNTADATEDPSFGNRRKLASLTTRLVSAALRMFGL